MNWRPRFQVRALRSGANHRRYFAIGWRLGFWPCLYAPFLQLVLGFWRVEIWCGLASYQRTPEAKLGKGPLKMPRPCVSCGALVQCRDPRQCIRPSTARSR